MMETSLATEQSNNRQPEAGRILLLMQEGEDRRLLVNWLRQRHEVTVGETAGDLEQAFDLCLVDEVLFARHHEALVDRKERAAQTFLPYLLVLRNRSVDELDSRVWQYVDEVVTTPVQKSELRGRLDGLLARRRLSGTLAKREERIRRILETVPDPIFVVDRRGRLLDANRAFEQYTGLDVEEDSGMVLADVPAFPPETTSVLSQFLEEDAPPELETDANGESPTNALVTYVTAAGTERSAEVAAATLPGDDTEEPQTLFVFRDVTERIGREQALQRERDRLDSFADMLAHEMRNPLNIAQGFLEEVTPTDQQEAAALQRVERAHTRMEQMVRELLTHARGGVQGPKQAVDLVQLARIAWDLTPTGGASLEFAADELVVEANPENLQTILQTMFRNAVQHAGPAPTVRIGPLPDGGFYVEDDGPGIPPAEREKVFERGYTRHSAGTGLGLTLVRELAAVQGLRVSVTGSAAGGCRFEFEAGEEPEKTPAE